jgi:protein-disulfide isomerase
MESDKVKARVARDQEQATSLGVEKTPTIFLNNRALAPTALAPPDLRAAVDAAINGTPPPSANSSSSAKQKDKPK